MQQGMATTDKPNDKSAQELKSQELKDKEYVRLKINYREEKIPNRVKLSIFCNKFSSPIHVSTSSNPPPSEEELEKLNDEIKNRVSVCLEKLPENSFIVESYPENCGGPDCYFKGRATEAGLDFIFNDEDLMFEENIPHSPYLEVSLPKNVLEAIQFHKNPPVNIQKTLGNIQKNLSNKHDFTISGHYKNEETEKKYTKGQKEFSKIFQKDTSQKVQVAVECNGNQFYPPLPDTIGDLYQDINIRRRRIMKDVPPDAQDRDFIILKPTVSSACTFIVKVNKVGVENLLNDKRVTALSLVEGDIANNTILPYNDKQIKKNNTLNRSPSKSFLQKEDANTISQYSAVNKVIGVIDGGIHEDFWGNGPWLISEACYSHADDLKRHVHNPCYITDVNVHYIYDYINEVSLCPNGNSSQVSSGSARIPRKLLDYALADGTKYYYEYSDEDHGSDVIKTIYDEVSGVKIKHYNVMYSKGEEQFPDYTDYLDEINIKKALTNLNQNSNGLAAVTISLGIQTQASFFCNQQYGFNEVELLRNKGIPVIAGSGNDASSGSASQLRWPACLDNVISVGGEINGYLLLESNTIPSVDFLANAQSVGFRNNNVVGTSIAAPKVASAFAILKNQFPSATLAEMTTALNTTGKMIRDYRVNKSFPLISVERALAYLQHGTVNIPEAEPLVHGEIYTNSLGNGFEGNNNEFGAALIVNIPASVATKLIEEESEFFILAFRGWDIDYVGEVSIYINGNYFKDIDSSGNNSYSFYRLNIPNNLFFVGENTIEFRIDDSTNTWGVKDLFFCNSGPVITLQLNNINTNMYGRSYGSDEHYSSLFLRFPNPGNAPSSFSLTGWDIDVADETAVYINDNFIGYLSTGHSSSYNNGDTFEINKALLNNSEWNYIELRQKQPDNQWNGIGDEKWGVTNLLVKRKFSVTPLIQLILLK
jgi:hypothetical protein